MLQKNFLLLLAGFFLGGFVLLNNACKDETETLNADCAGNTATYDTNVKVILQAKCMPCHTAGGIGLASADLTNYTTTKKLADQGKIFEILEAKSMPPTGMGVDPLTDVEWANLACWHNQGYLDK